MLPFATCDEGEENYRNALYTGMQGKWLMSSESLNYNSCTYITRMTMEFNKVGDAVRRKERESICGSQRALTIMETDSFKYKIDPEDNRIFINYPGHVYTYQLTLLTGKVMALIIYENGKIISDREEWLKIKTD
jgi:tRNA G37 N-methylase Trm5